MISCNQCGEENREEARFCRHCGYDFGKTTRPESESPPFSSGPPVPTGKENGALQQKDALEEKPVAGVAEGKTSEQLVSVADVKEVDAPQQLLPTEDEGSDITPSVPTENTTASTALNQRISGANPVEGRSLSKGDLLQNRYRIAETISQDDTCIVYNVEDLLLCWNCAHVQPLLDETFCENCGATTDQKVQVRIREVGLSSETPEIAEGIFEENGHLYQVEPQDKLPEGTQTSTIQFTIGYQSDAGELREIDEDSILILHLSTLCEMENEPLLGFFAVADGIGGHDAGEVASKTVVRSLAASFMNNIFTSEVLGDTLSSDELRKHLKEAILTANQAVLDIRAQTESDLGSTLTAILIRNTQAIIANVGDSRTYLMRMGKLSQITEDHSLVAKMVAQNIIQQEEIYTHEQKGVIYRSLGDKPELEIDDSLFELTLEPGDRLLVCCDGLWEMVRDDIIEDTLLEYHDPQIACDRLVKLANLSGGEDNISVIVIDIRSL